MTTRYPCVSIALEMLVERVRTFFADRAA